MIPPVSQERFRYLSLFKGHLQILAQIGKPHPRREDFFELRGLFRSQNGLCVVLAVRFGELFCQFVAIFEKWCRKCG